MSCDSRSGNSSKTCCCVSPAARRSSTSTTRIRIPRTHGRPPHWAGFTVMRSGSSGTTTILRRTPPDCQRVRSRRVPIGVGNPPRRRGKAGKKDVSRSGARPGGRSPRRGIPAGARRRKRSVVRERKRTTLTSPKPKVMRAATPDRIRRLQDSPRPRRKPAPSRQPSRRGADALTQLLCLHGDHLILAAADVRRATLRNVVSAPPGSAGPIPCIASPCDRPG